MSRLTNPLVRRVLRGWAQRSPDELAAQLERGVHRLCRANLSGEEREQLHRVAAEAAAALLVRLAEVEAGRASVRSAAAEGDDARLADLLGGRP